MWFQINPTKCPEKVFTYVLPSTKQTLFWDTLYILSAEMSKAWALIPMI